MVEPVRAEGVTINISNGGLRFAVDCALRVGDLCLLVIDGDDGEHIKRGRVVWTREARDGLIVGLQFANVH
jgi:hypothetical protein